MALLLVAERQEARQRSLGEVAAELRKQLEREQRQAAIERLVSSLRARAHIQDLEPLAIEDVQAVAGVEGNAEVLQQQVDERVELLRAPRLEALGEIEAEAEDPNRQPARIDPEPVDPEPIDPGAEALGPEDDPLDGR